MSGAVATVIADETPRELAHPQRTLRGAVMNDAPLEWVGHWGGVCKGYEYNSDRVSDANKSGTLNKAGLADSTGEPLKVSLIMSARDGELELNSLSVSSVDNAASAQAADDQPDIEFSHKGNSSRLVVRNGARVVIRGDSQIGGITVRGPGAGIYIGGNARIVSKEADDASGSAAGAPNRASGGRPVAVPLPDRPGAVLSGEPNNHALVIGGTATFQGHHFRADDGLAIANTATIKADRVDLDNKTYYPKGQPIYVTGRHDSGYMIAKLGGESMEPVENERGQMRDRPAERSIILLSDSKEIVEAHSKRTGDGVITQETLVALPKGESGSARYQHVVSKYSRKSDDTEMNVDIRVENLDSHKKLKSSFRIAGTLQRKK